MAIVSIKGHSPAGRRDVSNFDGNEVKVSAMRMMTEAKFELQ